VQFLIIALGLSVLQAHNSSHVTSIDLWRNYLIKFKKIFIMWTKPAATEMRFGFEVTMYVMNK
jgi:pyrroloquinoline quinone biosynthesis protein A